MSKSRVNTVIDAINAFWDLTITVSGLTTVLATIIINTFLS